MNENIPITTLDAAKEFFFLMGCSHFHMSREYPDRYKEYCNLGISEDIEYKWREECFHQLFDEYMQNGNNKRAWSLHSSMEKLSKCLDTDDVYEKMLAATRKAYDIVPDGYRVIVAETINGRQSHECRGGLIYRSFDRGRRDHAAAFAKLSISLAKSDYRPEHIDKALRKRIDCAVGDCQSIREDLGII